MLARRSSGRPKAGYAEAAQLQADRVAALSQILDVLPDAAAIVDDSDRVLAASANCVAMGIVSLDRIAPVEVRALNREVHRLSKTQSRDVIIKRNGSRLGEWEARIQISPIDDELSLLIAQDLSEERRLNDVRRDFVANVSHELKTPVGALSLLAEAVQAADTDIEQVRHFTSRMQIEVKRLTAMISDLVALSQVQGDAPLRNSAPVNVADIINEAVDTTKIAAEQKGIEVVVSDDVNVGKIFGDDDQLNAALSNLISNAIKYSPAHTKVGVGSRRVDNMIEISVTDQGPGIPESDVERIFERFYRVDPARSRDTGGTGLGLAIVKHVCANHGGDCLVWSQVGQGSTFTLRFPAYQNGAGTPTEVTGK
jgi:two-component system, OmpR family, sensor histidine kinase SenX3